MFHLILGSTSPYRKELLAKLQIPFSVSKPLIDEEKEKDPRLTPLELAQHLAKLKAQSLRQDQALIIGGDQLVELDQKIFGKPHTAEGAQKQLQMMQGQTHHLITAVHLAAPERDYAFVNITKLKMKSLSPEQIQKYILLDSPFDCAGSYKIEKNGLALMESIETSDFSAIQGLPLLELSQALTQFGIHSFLGDQPR